MKYQKVGDDARVWVVTRGLGGRLQHEVDPELFAALHPGASAEEIAEAFVIAAGTAEVAQTRVW